MTLMPGAGGDPKKLMSWVDESPDSTDAVPSAELPITQGRLRVGTLEREEAQEILDTALIGGYLELEEFERRVDLITQAKVQGDIDKVLCDLPNHVRITRQVNAEATAGQASGAFSNDAGAIAKGLTSFSASALPRSASLQDLGIKSNTLLYRVAEAGKAGGNAPPISYGQVVNAKTPSDFTHALHRVGKGLDVAKTTSVVFAVVFTIIGILTVIATNPALIPAGIGTIVIGGLFSHSVAKEVIFYKYRISGADERLYRELATMTPDSRQTALGYVYRAQAVENPPRMGDFVYEAINGVRARRGVISSRTSALTKRSKTS